MVTAREKFQEGQRVQLTKKGLSQGLEGTSNRRTGVVKGFPVAGFGDISKLVYVVRDGTRTKTSYHMDFWEPDE